VVARVEKLEHVLLLVLEVKPGENELKSPTKVDTLSILRSGSVQLGGRHFKKFRINKGEPHEQFAFNQFARLECPGNQP
jgi:hypothetical protein